MDKLRNKEKQTKFDDQSYSLTLFRLLLYYLLDLKLMILLITIVMNILHKKDKSNLILTKNENSFKLSYTNTNIVSDFFELLENIKF